MEIPFPGMQNGQKNDGSFKIRFRKTKTDKECVNYLKIECTENAFHRKGSGRNRCFPCPSLNSIWKRVRVFQQTIQPCHSNYSSRSSESEGVEAEKQSTDSPEAIIRKQYIQSRLSCLLCRRWIHLRCSVSRSGPTQDQQHFYVQRRPSRRILEIGTLDSKWKSIRNER